MPRFTRRNLLKPTLAATVGGAALTTLPARAAATRAAAIPGGRERLLLDPNWRFVLGHASNPAYDFGFGSGNGWAVELPFENAEELTEHGYKPIGRNYSAASIGWYRRTFQIPATSTRTARTCAWSPSRCGTRIGWWFPSPTTR